MAKIKVSGLEGAALDWAVAHVEQHPNYIEPGAYGSKPHVIIHQPPPSIDRNAVFSPSQDWDQGGPLIEKYRLWIGAPDAFGKADWTASTGEGCIMRAPTLLIAACRAIVAFKLGSCILVPDELVN